MAECLEQQICIKSCVKFGDMKFKFHWKQKWFMAMNSGITDSQLRVMNVLEDLLPAEILKQPMKCRGHYKGSSNNNRRNYESSGEFVWLTQFNQF